MWAKISFLRLDFQQLAHTMLCCASLWANCRKGRMEGDRFPQLPSLAPATSPNVDRPRRVFDTCELYAPLVPGMYCSSSHRAAAGSALAFAVAAGRGARRCAVQTGAASGSVRVLAGQVACHWDPERSAVSCQQLLDGSAGQVASA